MRAQRATHVILSGDLSGDYIVVEQRDDGSVLVKPDTSMAAIHRRHGLTPATLEEFEPEQGGIPAARRRGLACRKAVGRPGRRRSCSMRPRGTRT
jgi:hypothetical protein